jgi:hypothetical protein
LRWLDGEGPLVAYEGPQDVEAAPGPASGSRVWLRAAADNSPGPGRQATFSYSADGTTFTPLGPAFTMNNAWEFFLGYRFAVLNHAAQALGGEVLVERCELSTP